MTQPRRPRRRERVPTAMGARIRPLMRAAGVTDEASEIRFAEQRVGIPIETLHRWLYEEIDPDALPVRPFCRLADALGTNVEYVVGTSDDPRPGFKLSYDESVLVQAFREVEDEAQRSRIVRITQDQASLAAIKPHHLNPYPHAPRGKPPKDSSQH